jgi:arginine-tRNA-protein transferase
VAIGVLDLLPDCVSAVYFLYHESIHRFQPGKIGALREIALAAEQGYRWWYSGFYIHTCPKMRYKIDFSPQYVLDPERLVWVEVTKDVLTLFDNKGYLHLGNSESQDVAEPSPEPENTSHGAANDDDDNTSVTHEEDDDGDLPLFQSKMPGLPSLDVMHQFPCKSC